MIKNLATAVLLAFVLGCASYNRNVYHIENTSVDLVTGGVHAFNLYYHSATNGVDANTLQQLNMQRQQVYLSAKKFQAAAAAMDAARLAYVTNSANTNYTTLQVALDSMLGQQTNVLNLIKMFVSH